jgi:hypothetical protein
VRVGSTGESKFSPAQSQTELQGADPARLAYN